LPAKIGGGLIGLIATIAITDHYTDHVELRTRTWLFGILILRLRGSAAGA